MFRSAWLASTWVALAGCLILCLPARAETAKSGPSFSCAKPSPIEAKICGSPELSARDRDLAKLFASAEAGAFGDGDSGQLAAQRQWIRRRDSNCAGPATGPDCLVGWYNDRLFELAVGALLSAPDLALAEIRRQAPKAAPVYEAIYRYATIDDAHRRVAVVSPLIAPALKALRVHQESGDPDLLLKDFASANAVANSDKGFSTLLVVASTWDYGRSGPWLLPCAAIIRRSGLAETLEPHYGGAIDSQTPQADCAAALPATPKLDQLVEAATDAQPSCEGTIRFTLGANYRKALAVLRMGKIDDFLDSASDTDGPKAFMIEHRPLMDAAAAEMTAYYANFPKARARKIPTGRAAAEAAVRGAFGLCE
jgi:uncharacterized protein